MFGPQKTAVLLLAAVLCRTGPDEPRNATAGSTGAAPNLPLGRLLVTALLFLSPHFCSGASVAAAKMPSALVGDFRTSQSCSTRLEKSLALVRRALKADYPQGRADRVGSHSTSVGEARLRQLVHGIPYRRGW